MKELPKRWLYFFIKEGTSMIINERVDNLLKEMEAHFKEAVEKNETARKELDEKVRALMDEHDKKEEVKRFTEIKDLTDYIALTLSMPLEDGTKEKIVEEIVGEASGRKTKEGV